MRDSTCCTLRFNTSHDVQPTISHIITSSLKMTRTELKHSIDILRKNWNIEDQAYQLLHYYCSQSPGYFWLMIFLLSRELILLINLLVNTDNLFFSASSELHVPFASFFLFSSMDHMNCGDKRRKNKQEIKLKSRDLYIDCEKKSVFWCFDFF